MIKVLIVDDQPIVRQGLVMVVDHMDGIQVIGEASDGREAVDKCKWIQPDVILMDVQMPEMNGVEATAIIKRVFPAVNVIILTTFNDDQYIFEALKSGASGYLLKDALPQQIKEAIEAVYRGGALIQPDVAQKVVTRIREWDQPSREKDPRLHLLTEREIELLRLIGEGKNNNEIADELNITRGTVKNHISNILVKLDLRDRTQLAIFALKNDLV